MIKYYSINGELIPKEEATLGVTDLAILRGYGLFDYFVVKKGQPLFFDDYLDRFQRSAKMLHLNPSFSREELKGQIMELIRANGMTEAGLKLILTGGYAADGYSPAEPNLVIVEMPPPRYPASRYEDGVKLMLHEYHRTLPAVKSINYLVGVHLLPAMKAAGAEDILFHFDGAIHETVRANFFIVTQDNKIVTADEHILHGVTRKRTIIAARKHYEVVERTLNLDELKTAKEAFITSSTKQLMPVVQIDDIKIGDGRPGKVSTHLLHLLRKAEKEYLAAVTV